MHNIVSPGKDNNLHLDGLKSKDDEYAEDNLLYEDTELAATTIHLQRRLSPIRQEANHTISAKPILLKNDSQDWYTPDWLDETLVAEGICPDMSELRTRTLNDMLTLDDNIPLTVTQIWINIHSVPREEGVVYNTYTAGTAASTNRFIVKMSRHNINGHEQQSNEIMRAQAIENMRVRALCKAFALEFNSLLLASTLR